MDMEIKKKLLEMLMGDMDKAEALKLKPKSEPVAIVETTESEVIPTGELKDKVKSLMGEEPQEKEDVTEEMDYEGEDEDAEGSRLIQKLKEMKRMKGACQ